MAYKSGAGGHDRNAKWGFFKAMKNPQDDEELEGMSREGIGGSFAIGTWYDSSMKGVSTKGAGAASSHCLAPMYLAK